MPRSLLSLFLLAIVAGGELRAVAASSWQAVKIGMDQAAMLAALGEPVLKTRGRGFEVWIYDGAAEVVCFRGSVVAWTAPGGVTTAGGRQIDLRSVDVRPSPVPTLPIRVYIPRGERSPGYEPVPARTLRIPRL